MRSQRCAASSMLDPLSRGHGSGSGLGNPGGNGKGTAVRSDRFAFVGEDVDAAGGDPAASSMGVDGSQPVAEPVGMVGGHPAPAPAAVDQGSPTTRAKPDRFVGFGLGPEATRRFVADYLELLQPRLAAIHRCLDARDAEGAKTAVLSLETSSSMLGATTLTSRLAELRTLLDQDSTPRRTALLSLVDNAASAVGRDLRAEYQSA